VNYSVVTRKPS